MFPSWLKTALCGETAFSFLFFFFLIIIIIIFLPLDKVSKDVMPGAMAAIFWPSFGQVERRKEMCLSNDTIGYLQQPWKHQVTPKTYACEIIHVLAI